MNINRKIGNRYQLLRKLGTGGMAAVYQAKDPYLDRYVAIKEMKEEVVQDKDGIERFLREAKIVGNLNHPNITNIYDIVKSENSYYIVMEYVEGQSLMDVINHSNGLPVTRAVNIAMQICDGLTHAHEKGVVHRDIKPHNILCSSDGKYKIADFGISLFQDATQLTLTGMILGSVHYFSPEQATETPVGETTDIYSLGVVLYEMLAGELPFDAEELVDVARQHAQEPVPSLHEKNPAIPAEIDHIIQRAMAKDPQQRYQSATQMKQALIRWQRTKEMNTSLQAAKQQLLQLPAAPSTATRKSTEKPQKPSRSKLYATAIIVPLLLVVVISIWLINTYENQTVPNTVVNKQSTTKTKPPGNHPWWKELPNPKQKEGLIFQQREVSGKDGEYEMKLLVNQQAARAFYYNIYVVDPFNSRLILANKRVEIPESQKLKPITFHISVPKYLLPTEGILKVEVFQKSQSRPDKKRYAEENLLQQWGNPPNK